MRIYYKNNIKIEFYEITFDKSVNKSKIIKILNIEEIPYKIKEADIIISDKPNLISQFTTNAITILTRLGYNVLDFKKYRIEDKDTLEYDPLLEIIEHNNINNSTSTSTDDRELIIDKDILEKENIYFDDIELEYYKELFISLQRHPRYIELYDLAQSNSEHARHWFFKGTYHFDEIIKNKSLMKMVKNTLKHSINNSLVAFSDNSSVINGFDNIIHLQLHTSNTYFFINKKLNIVLTAETHNFPTLISPFQGATTGVGGRIRDNQATGTGAIVISSLAGYCVGDISESNVKNYGNYKLPVNILIEASNGASDYGNKFGEAIIGGFTRSFGMILDSKERIEWVKPIMFSAGIGAISDNHTYKKKIKPDMIVVRLGGPAYKIGMGGGYSSSVNQNSDNCNTDYSAVQRGDPEMETKMNNVIRYLIDNYNPIISIHDQGSGGLANVVKEIVYPYGGEINLENVTLGDKSMTPLEIWCSEFQESNVIVIHKNDIELVQNLALRENICCDLLGIITSSKKIVVNYKGKVLVDLPLEEILEPPLRKTYDMTEIKYSKKETGLGIPQLLNTMIIKVLGHLDVCSKRFLVNKVDRSVSGLIAQQQCVGPFHTPISNYQLTALSYLTTKGIATSIGERPILSLLDYESCGSMAVGEMVTNMMGVYIGGTPKYIKCSSNWMWALKREGENANLYETCETMCSIMSVLGIGVDGGKDSLSMGVKIDDENISAPGNLVITGYAPCPNIYYKATPNLKKYNTKLILIRFSDKLRMGGSVYQRVLNNLTGPAPKLTIEYATKLRECFMIIQDAISKNRIYSLHDISDGGLMTTLCEMAISSDIGIDIDIHMKNIEEYLFSEELGIVLEVDKYYTMFEQYLREYNIEFEIIGTTMLTKNVKINDIFNTPITILREYWESTSNKLERKQMYKDKALQQENIKYYSHKEMYYLNSYVKYNCNVKYNSNILKDGPKVAIIRDEGSNGFKEMAGAFSMAQFSAFDIHMNDIIKCPKIINNFDGIVFVGGFSLSDTFGAATGWSSSIKYKDSIKSEFKKFYKRDNTFSLGVCNGCQLMIKLNLITDNVDIVDNDSDRFESRFTTVIVKDTNSIFFKKMDGIIFGMWVAHKTGKFVNTNKISDNNIPLVYSYNSKATPIYPFNPNGSERGIAAISSKDGRHLAMMPHPERSFLPWQLPYTCKYTDIKQSPWFTMFENAYKWVTKE
tara:strand:+ start:4439 stop:8053 length:3615 start_codon:yes stop_codon:yes gene_type:complete